MRGFPVLYKEAEKSPKTVSFIYPKEGPRPKIFEKE